MTPQRILVLDIETSPHLVYAFGLFKQTISIGQIKEPTRILCWAAQFVGEKRIHFGAEWLDPGHMGTLHSLLSVTDAVVHYNGSTFDMPHIRRELALAGLDPLPGIKNIDLLSVTKRQFRMASNKLDWVAGQFLGEGKVSHTGFQLWRDVLDGKPKARKLMERYCRGDVALTMRLYDFLLPYITSHPHQGLHTGVGDCCNKCGGTDLERRGFAYTDQSRFQQYRCNNCGGWTRSTMRVQGVVSRGVGA